MLELKRLLDTTFDWGLDFVVKRRFYRNNYNEYIKLVYTELERDNIELIKKYKYEKNFPISENSKDCESKEKINVWYCWWQGEEKMPPVIRMCYNSIKRNLPKDICTIHLITLENYRQYVEFPKYIMDKFSKGIISMTHLSDLLRVTLVSQYGGFFIDSGFYFNDKIGKDFLSQEFFVRKRKVESSSRSIAKGRWTGNYFIGQSGDFYFCFLRDALLKYWEKHDTLIHYFLIDFLIWIMYDNFTEVRERILAIPECDPCVHDLQKVINNKFDKDIFKSLTQNTKVFKLTQKKEVKERTEAGELTFYGYLLQNEQQSMVIDDELPGHQS